MKRLLKQLVELMATLVVLPAVVLCRAGIWLLGPERGFAGWSQLFALAPGLIGVFLRRAFYRLVLPRCGTDCCLTFGTILSHPTACIGDRVYVGANCSLGDVELEDDVLLASHVSVMNGSQQHGIARLDVPIREQPGVFVPVRIGRDSWIGERAVIAADVGRHCVIGAGSVVTKPIPDYAIAVGVPAKVIRFRNETLFHPEGMAAISRGSERSADPRFVARSDLHPGGMQESKFAVSNESAGIPPGCDSVLNIYRGSAL